MKHFFPPLRVPIVCLQKQSGKRRSPAYSMASREMAFLCFQQRKRVFLRLFGLCRCISTPHGCYLLACSLRTLICTKGTHHKKGKPHAKTAVNKSNEWFCVAHCTGQQTYINSTMFPTFLRANEHQLVQGLCAGL